MNESCEVNVKGVGREEIGKGRCGEKFYFFI